MNKKHPMSRTSFNLQLAAKGIQGGVFTNQCVNNDKYMETSRDIWTCLVCIKQCKATKQEGGVTVTRIYVVVVLIIVALL